MTDGIEGYGLKSREEISDEELLIACLKNAPEGTNKKQAARLIKYYEIILSRPTGPLHIFPQPIYQ